MLECWIVTFSILGRIVGTATMFGFAAGWLAASLSVSSVGSWALQHPKEV